MDDLRKAATTALEMLCGSIPMDSKAAVFALRAALAAPQQEPIGHLPMWAYLKLTGELGADDPAEFSVTSPIYSHPLDAEKTVPLYTCPQRKPLTEKQIDDCFESVMFDPEIEPSRVLIARAVERAHGIL